ncbi:hypothetical protein Ancab_003759, partial [Ancistrocladus abbreviatus]
MNDDDSQFRTPTSTWKKNLTTPLVMWDSLLFLSLSSHNSQPTTSRLAAHRGSIDHVTGPARALRIRKQIYPSFHLYRIANIE